MTNEEAIELLDKITSYCDFTDEYGDMIDSTPYYEVLDLAIKALEQEDVLDKIKDEINSPNRGTCDYFIVDRIEEIINKHKAESEGEK